METNLNQKLITAVLNNIPKNVKPVSFLMESLQLSRESAYRRLRGEIPFAMDEISILSATLAFSIDEIVGNIKKYRAFFNFNPEVEDSEKMFLAMMKSCCENTENMVKADIAESIIALNCLPPIFRVFFDNIFKFTFYKWLLQDSIVSSQKNFSEIIIPPETAILQKKIQNHLNIINDSILILDPNIFGSLIKDIQYFFQRKLLNTKELEILREEIFALIDFFEKIAKTGILGYSAKIQLYLSPLYINANIGHFRFDDTIGSLFWVHTANPIVIYNPEICSMYKRWLNSLKRQSALISQSNEMLQTDFFDQQRKLVKQNLPLRIIGK
jgi:hypothetical protein